MGKTILVSSHILPELADICNKIGIIERGKLEFDGDVQTAIRQVRQHTVYLVAVGDGKWEIYVGGAGGSHVRKGDLLCTVGSHEEVLQITGRFLQLYREEAKYKERTYTWVERVGIERVRAIVVDDSEGIAARLDAAMQESVDAYRDPWGQIIERELGPQAANAALAAVEG